MFNGLRKIKLLLFFLLWVPVVYAEEMRVYTSLESFSHSEPIAIKSISGNWEGDFSSGELAFSVDRAEIGVGWKQWKLGFVHRYDYFYEFSSDTAELKYKTENKINLVPGESFDLYIKANSIISSGLSLTHTQAFSNGNFGVTVSYLQAQRLTSGTLTGKADVLTEKDYNLDFEVDYYYSEDKIFDRQVAKPEGQGYSLDFDLDWDINSAWNVNLNIDDLFARVYWDNAPRTIATASTATKEFDENGYVIFNPVISGIETNQDFTQILPRKVILISDYKWHNYSLLAEVRDYEIKRFYSVGAGLSLSDNDQLKFYYNFTAQALNIAYYNKWLRLGITTDDFNINKARTFAVDFSVVYAF